MMRYVRFIAHPVNEVKGDANKILNLMYNNFKETLRYDLYEYIRKYCKDLHGAYPEGMTERGETRVSAALTQESIYEATSDFLLEHPDYMDRMTKVRCRLDTLAYCKGKKDPFEDDQQEFLKKISKYLGKSSINNYSGHFTSVLFQYVSKGDFKTCHKLINGYADRLDDKLNALEEKCDRDMAKLGGSDRREYQRCGLERGRCQFFKIHLEKEIKHCISLYEKVIKPEDMEEFYRKLYEMPPMG